MTTRFNRHELFSEKMMDFHSETIRLVEFYHLERCENWFTPLYNMLCGIWDGYYYSEMIPLAKEMELPQSIIDRIEFTELYIKL